MTCVALSVPRVRAQPAPPCRRSPSTAAWLHAAGGWGHLISDPQSSCPRTAQLLASPHASLQAVIILLTLLHLNVKNMRIGPKAPAFLTPEALKVCL